MSPSIFNYSDYRAFLSDWLACKGQSADRHKFTLGAISKRAGQISKAHLCLILARKRQLSAKKTFQLGVALGLKKDELQYFEHLVQFNSARSLREKEHFLQKMAGFRLKSGSEKMSSQHYLGLYSWHCLVIRELSKHPEFIPDPALISKRLKGHLSTGEAKQALAVLVESGLVERGADGKIKANDVSLHSSDEIHSVAIQTYHRSCLILAKKVLESDSIEDREFGSVNLIVSTRQMKWLKEKIKALRCELAELESDADAREVCQINFQILKLT